MILYVYYCHGAEGRAENVRISHALLAISTAAYMGTFIDGQARSQSVGQRIATVLGSWTTAISIAVHTNGKVLIASRAILARTCLIGITGVCATIHRAPSGGDQCAGCSLAVVGVKCHSGRQRERCGQQHDAAE